MTAPRPAPGRERPNLLARLGQHGDLNFYLTNYVPRRALTRLVGRLSRIEQPLLRDLSMWIWRVFSNDLDLSDARKSEFTSVHDCFIRELKDGARPVDPDPATVASPCDAVVGAHGRIRGGEILQVKGSPYRIGELLGDETLAAQLEGGCFVTLRLRSTMYHRFHAPLDCRIRYARYIAGDVRNVNPPALARVPRLLCSNERTVLPLTLTDGEDAIILVPVAAILVASMRIHCLPHTLDLRYRGPHLLPCDARYRRGEELGYFQHGSTIVVLSNHRYRPLESLVEGENIRMGEALLRECEAGDSNAPDCLTA